MEQQKIVVIGNIYASFDFKYQNPLKIECFIAENGYYTHCGTLNAAKNFLNIDFTEVDQAIRDDKYMNILQGGIRLMVFPKAQMIMPGFIDSHCHPISGNMQEKRCRIQGLNNWSSAKEAIQKYIQDQNFQKGQWIFIYGYSEGWFKDIEQQIKLLDDINIDCPMVIMRDDMHSYWINSKAINITGITNISEQPSGGIIGIDSMGNLNGILADTAMNIIRVYFPKQNMQERLQNLDEALQTLMDNGIVGYCDAAVKEVMFQVYIQYYQQQRQSRKKTPWAYMCICWNQLFLDQLQDKDITMTFKHLDEMINEYNCLVQQKLIDPEQLACRSVKLFIDGVIESQTALLNTCYSGCQHKGVLMINEEQLNNILPNLNKRNLQAHMHSIGDGATDTVIRVLDKNNNNNNKNNSNNNNNDNNDNDNNDNNNNNNNNNNNQLHQTNQRNYLAHLQFVSPLAVPKFEQLSLGCNFSPLWFYEYPEFSVLDQMVDPQIVDRMYPIKDLHQNPIGFGSDWPVSSLNPLRGIEVAVTRQPINYKGDFKPIGSASQKISLHQALNYYTLGSAYLLHNEHRSGSIEVNKRADFIILDQDLFEIEPSLIAQCRVIKTFILGIC